MVVKWKWINSTKTKTYYAWRNMRSRCLYPSNASYSDYGGRGIHVCDRWADDFDAFVEDMGDPEEHQTLERIDHNGPYSPENCRWASWVDQANNRRNNRLITHDGKTQTMSQWARELGLGSDTLWRRLQNNSPEVSLVRETIAKAAMHGTRHMYSRHGCRCADCRAAHAKHCRDMKRNRVQSLRLQRDSDTLAA